MTDPLVNACPLCRRSPYIACIGMGAEYGYSHAARWELVLKDED